LIQGAFNGESAISFPLAVRYSERAARDVFGDAFEDGNANIALND
jgi:hypothetical protein